MQKQKWIFIASAAVVILLGALLRFYKLNAIPPGIQYDEAYNGIDALNAIETNDYAVFYPDNFGREAFHINVESFLIKYLGATNFSLRVTNAIWGSLTVLGFFLLLLELRLSRLSVLMGTFMLSFSFWHLNFSRTAYRAIMVPLLLCWIFYFFFKGLNAKKLKPLYFGLSGALTGLGLHTYIAFRVAPLILIVLAVCLFFLKKDFIKTYWKSALVYFFAAALVVLPIGLYFASHWADLTGRASAVSVFNAPGMSFPQAFGKSLAYHLGAFYFHGDTNQRHNHNGQALIPPAWSVLFTLGFLISLKEIIHTKFNLIRYLLGKLKTKDKESLTTPLFYPSLLGQSIFWVMLIPGVLSIEGIPHALRIIGAIPGVFLLSALPFEHITRLYQRIKTSETLAMKPWRWNILRTSTVGLVLIVIASGLTQAYLYFNIWAKDQRTYAAFEKNLYELGLLVKNLPTKKNNYLITNQNIAVSEDGKHSSLKTTEYIAYPQIKQYSFMHALEGIASLQCQDTLIVFQEADGWLIEQFKNHCPNLNATQQSPPNSSYKFWVMQ